MGVQYAQILKVAESCFQGETQLFQL
uniref:Uncharacterized protein n=1 Tax=Anguilla anguilla TaxID=7936 RepID=A0A0E9VI28_ANGAN